MAEEYDSVLVFLLDMLKSIYLVSNEAKIKLLYKETYSLKEIKSLKQVGMNYIYIYIFTSNINMYTIYITYKYTK